jgi:WD40 repeat protein
MFLEKIKHIQPHTSKIWSVKFAPDGSRAASAASDNTVLIYTTTALYLSTCH